LDKAKQAIYAEERVGGLSRDWLRRYFQRGTGQWEGHYRVKAAVTKRVSFRQINLIEGYSHPQPFHAIFCRNVMIYFDRPTQERLVNRLCGFLAPDGWLFIGHSESLNGLNVPLRCVRPSIYRKGHD